jgi:hypothetical protein
MASHPTKTLSVAVESGMAHCGRDAAPTSVVFCLNNSDFSGSCGHCMQRPIFIRLEAFTVTELVLREPSAAPSTQTAFGSIVRPSLIRAFHRTLTIILEALLISVTSDCAELMVPILYPAIDSHWWSMWVGGFLSKRLIMCRCHFSTQWPACSPVTAHRVSWSSQWVPRQFICEELQLPRAVLCVAALHNFYSSPIIIMINSRNMR